LRRLAAVRLVFPARETAFLRFVALAGVRRPLVRLLELAIVDEA
jgi:hypothetical protein